MGKGMRGDMTGSMADNRAKQSQNRNPGLMFRGPEQKVSPSLPPNNLDPYLIPQQRMGGVIPEMMPQVMPGSQIMPNIPQDISVVQNPIPSGGNGMGGPPVNYAMNTGITGGFDPNEYLKNRQPAPSGKFEL